MVGRAQGTHTAKLGEAGSRQAGTPSRPQPSPTLSAHPCSIPRQLHHTIRPPAALPSPPRRPPAALPAALPSPPCHPPLMTRSPRLCCCPKSSHSSLLRVSTGPAACGWGGAHSHWGVTHTQTACTDRSGSTHTCTAGWSVEELSHSAHARSTQTHRGGPRIQVDDGACTCTAESLHCDVCPAWHPASQPGAQPGAHPTSQPTSQFPPHTPTHPTPTLSR